MLRKWVKGITGLQQGVPAQEKQKLLLEASGSIAIYTNSTLVSSGQTEGPADLWAGHSLYPMPPFLEVPINHAHIESIENQRTPT